MMRFINGGQPMSEALSEHFLSRQQRSLAHTGTCIGAMLQVDTGELIGVAGMQALDRVARLDLARWVSPAHWRRGYAIEAAVAVCRDAFERLRQPLCSLRSIAKTPHPGPLRASWACASSRPSSPATMHRGACHRRSMCTACGPRNASFQPP
ncbi:GNAT family N-acetyltransferase [Algiphilus sp. W345]|uniref:GNAT family N-acetyltransferase n=1 Tax=Banduia mediterranea TaxID=3075609 RepID=A0ABU2WH20_9GAMM|nr:GNAT family N-acetyltransferase [Algiphilus sp. W345]MDT0496934.1 GNAT family N-acetyltransferase [Algiphilus sp. W345]